jgi:maltokinase
VESPAVESRGGQLVGLLAEWVPRQRWFAGKGRHLDGLEIVARTALSDWFQHLIVRVDYADGGLGDVYQVPVIVRPDAPFGHEGFLIGRLGAGLVYDGLHDPDGSATLLHFLREGRTQEDLSGVSWDELADYPAHAVGAEQSNTSIVYGESYIMKVFRRLWPGINPDVEVTRALAEAGSTHVARPLAQLSGTLEGEPTTLAFMQEFLRSGTEGWRLAQASVRDLYAEADLHADEVGGDFAAESERLGVATAEVHQSLADALPTAAADADYWRSEAAAMQARLDLALKTVDELSPHEAGLRALFDALADRTAPLGLQRVHGDYHLGQVLRVESGWVLFDFEGEPARPVAERTVLAPALRDVAGMLRSFDYAAQSMLMDRDDGAALAYRAREWADRNRDAFLAGYAAAAGREVAADVDVLRALEADKAVYEVLYEARHRPSWLRIPLAALESLISR